MQPRFVEKAEFRVVGLRERFAQGRIEGIPALWDRFIRRAHEIAGAIPGVHYGVCEEDPSAPKGEAGFFYAPCVGVASPGPVPEGMVAITVPAGRYAVFTHRGPIADLSKTVLAVWREWLPAAGLRPTGAPDFELYDERFRGSDPSSEVDVYVPVAG